jgi:hypothetical protein
MKIKAIHTIITAGLGLTTAVLISSCAPGPIEPSSDMPWNHPTESAGSSALGMLESPAQKQRPGLGTGWGNEVKSDIGYTNFTRSSSKPAGTAAIYYNDKEGVAAMTDDWKYSGKGMQQAANGLVEWGVKGGWSDLKNYHSSGRRYVVGRNNSNYTLVVKNRCRSRLEVVLSVDGLDVMDGKDASFSKRGYIIHPGQTLKVEGFRTSESAVAAFKFSSVSQSYSNQRHGKTRNVGVIGMAVFTQKGVDPWKWSHQAVKQRHGAAPFAEAPSARAR